MVNLIMFGVVSQCGGECHCVWCMCGLVVNNGTGSDQLIEMKVLYMTSSTHGDMDRM